MPRLWRAHNFLTRNGHNLMGDFSYEVGSHKFRFRSVDTTVKKLCRPYFIEGIPIEVHFHGIGHIDFSRNDENLDLPAVQQFLLEEGIMGIPTIFLERARLNYFLDLIKNFSALKQDGKLQNILGLALEGPLLLSGGGTPREGRWIPTWEEWKKIAACGQKRLKYMVISPDWDPSFLKPVAELFLTNGVYLSLGHIRKTATQGAVQGIYLVADLAKKSGFPPYSAAISVDHFLNDMPQNIKHAWRSASERRMRSRQMMDIDIGNWSMNSLEQQIGDVPAALIRLARDGLVTLFLNFDGQHVDLQICRRVYEMVGSAAIVAMTDRMETDIFGRSHLTKGKVGTLWYQERGLVAVGSSTLDEQMTNMRALTIPEKDIWQMCALNPAQIFVQSTATRRKYMSFVDDRSLRVGIEAN